jgi:hypothetical protein
VCDCPRYALAAAGFFAVVAMVLMAPLFLTGPDPREGPDLRRVMKIGVGVFLVLASLHFLVTFLAVLAAAFAGRAHAAIRIWAVGKALVGMLLGSAGGVGVMVLLWGLLSLE